ncbi:MAG TPA: hypothetical protein VL282_09250, partial [Tepidisphaeraceae bacterium]|nr:hypothetical protein [Tepidisphaeraceae bacterium]
RFDVEHAGDTLELAQIQCDDRIQAHAILQRLEKPPILVGSEGDCMGSLHLTAAASRFLRVQLLTGRRGR